MNRSPHRLGRYIAKARQLVRQPGEALRLAQQAGTKLDGAGQRLDQVRQELGTMVAMLKAWARGEYPGVSATALLSIAAGVLYFVAPFDAVPDFLFGFGLIDDVAVIGYIVKQVRTELTAFASWQALQGTSNSVEQAERLADEPED